VNWKNLALFLLLQNGVLLAQDEEVGSFKYSPPPEEHALRHKPPHPLSQPPPQPQAPKEQPRMTLTGNWNGARAKLNEAGVEITGSYVNEALGNPIGGKHRGFAYADSWGVNLFLDWEKIAKLKGLSLFSSFSFRTGTNLSSRKIDNQFPVAEVFGGETYSLCELYLKQTLFDNRFTLKAGRLCAGNDFLSSPLYWEFVSNAFNGNPISIFFNTELTAYPFAMWGAYASVKPFSNLLGKFAIYNNNEDVTKNKYHGINFTFSSTQGVTLITEWIYSVNQEHGLPGHYKVGYYYVTGEVPQFTGGNQKGNYGYYFLIDHMIYRKGGPRSTRGITPFAAFVFAPKDRNEFPFFMMGGVVYQGPFSSRPNDSAAFGVAYGNYSEDLRHVQRQARAMRVHGSFGNKPETFETVLELNYWFQVNGWLELTPDLQYIINPKGFGTIPNALVVGMQIAIQL
jgi:porin